MMKSKLLASTMLVSAAALASAGSASALDLKIGGFSEFWVGYADTDKKKTGTSMASDFDVKMDHEIHFKAEEKLSNGITVGALFEMEAGNGNDGAGGGQGASEFDETFGWIKTRAGQINIGANDVASAYIGGVRTVGPVGITKSDAGDWDPAGNYELNNTDVDLGAGDAQNVTYFTPKVGGAQIIVSWTPDSSDNGISDYDDSEAGTAGFGHNTFSGAAKWGGKFGGVGVNLGAGYTHLELPDATADNDGVGYGLTGGVTVGPVNLTATYANEKGGSDRDRYYALAALFKAGKNTFSAGYAHSVEDRKTTGAGSNNNDLLVFGVEHSLDKGVTFAGSVFFNDSEKRDSATNTDAVGIVGGFKIKY